MNLKQEAVRAVRWTAITRLGVIAAQMLQVFVLARYVSESDFGLFAIVMLVVQAVHQYSDVGVGSAIVQRRKCTSNELSSLYWLNVGLAFFLALLSIACSPLIAAFFGDDRLIGLLTIAAATLAIGGFGQQFQHLLQKEMRFRLRAFVELSATASGAAVAIASAQMGYGVYAFIHGMLLSSILRNSLYVCVGLRYHRPKCHFDRHDLNGYLRFGMLISGQRLIGLLYQRIDSIIIGHMLGPSVLGLYYFAQQFSSQLYQWILPVITTAAFPTLAKLQDNPLRQQMAFARMMQVVWLVAFPALAGMIVIADDILMVFFPASWWPATSIVRILLVVTLLRCVAAPIGPLIMAKGRVDLGIYVNLGHLVLTATALLVGSSFGLHAVAWSLCASTVITTVAWFFVLRHFLDIAPRPLLERLFFPFIASVLMCGVCSALHRWLTSTGTQPLVALLATILSGAVVYSLATVAFNAEMKTAFTELLGLPPTARGLHPQKDFNND